MKTINNITRAICILMGFILSTQALSQTQNIPPGNGPSISNILGGVQIPIEDAPYQVSMEVNGSHICGGSIIADRWILTAAHCIVMGGATAANTTIHAGSTNQTNNGTGQIIQAQTLFVHPGYNNFTLENDIALIYLSQPLQFNHSVIPIEYANPCNTSLSDIAPGNEAFLTGWGITCNNCPGAANLQGVTMPLISQANAMAINQAYNPNYTNNISANMLPFYDVGSGAGPGDSGGPAVINNNGYQINIGASSWGYWPKDQLPTIYANVRNYTTWIESITGLVINSPGVDLYTKDKPWDMGFEPFAYNYPWTSEDIWVRNQNDGLDDHQNPEYYQQPGNSNYVYVRVRNKGCTPSQGNEVIHLYWAKAATALSWPNHWNGSMSVAGNSLGDIVGSVSLPVIQPGEAYVAVFPWLPPNPANFVGLAGDPVFFADEPHHFCLLSRIEAGNDPMAVTETDNLMGNVLNNNNIAWKNVTVVDSNPTNFVGDKVDTGASVLVGNAWREDDIFTIEFTNPEFYEGNPITKEAEITITLDELLWKYWETGGFKCTDLKIIDASARRLLMTEKTARLEHIPFPANERSLLHVNFNFLTREISDKEEFTFLVNQRRFEDDAIVGGEEFTIYKKPRNRFYANAGGNKEIELYDNTTLNAYPIDEQAEYNWYDENDRLIYSGLDFTVSPQITSRYKLEVIARADRFKDYDEVEVKVKKNFIRSISPNPSSDFIRIDYLTADARSAYLMISPLYSGTSHQFILNINESERVIDISNLPSGQYAVVMVCDGNIADFKNILIH